MGLLERDGPLLALRQAAAQAVAGEGRVVFIGGEAGAGKTALIEHFTREALPAAPRVLWGACDPLFTPRPLGPLHDMAPALLQATERTDFFPAVLRELKVRPTVMVFEDVHWADEATLDLLRYLGRRIGRTPSLLVLTFRDDELGPRHPLRLVLGDLASSVSARRIALQPLSEAAVRQLVGDRGIDAAALHRQTGGNPFFVSEVLAGMEPMPPTIRDAVLARVARLSPDGRAVLEAAAVLGPRVEPALLARVAGVDPPTSGSPPLDDWPALDECLSGGILLDQGEWLTFRHELAREAVLHAVAPTRRSALHARALAALQGDPAAGSDLNRLTHHAEGAGDVEAVLRYAPAAAGEASAARSHRAAATLYELALRHADTRSPREQARLLEAFALECNLVDRRVEGVEVCRKAVAIWRELGEPVREGAVRAHLANMLIGVGDTAAAERHSREAVAILERQPPGEELAFAYRMLANIHFLDHNYAKAIAWAEKGIAVAESLDLTGEFLSLRNIVGSALIYIDYERGCRFLAANLEAARKAGRDSTVAHAYANLGSGACELYDLPRAERYLSEGIAFAAERDLDRLRLYMTAWSAVLFLRLARWDEARAAAETVLAYPGVSVPSRVTALAALGLLRARLGRDGAHEALDEALALIEGMSNLHRVGLVRAARAEAAWLAGDPARAAVEAAAAYDLALAKRHPWFAGELAAWQWPANPPPLPEWIAEPFRWQLEGQAGRAAALWDELGCPFEAARAMAAGDETGRIEALARFDKLGARSAAETLRRKLRSEGVSHIPRGPRPRTRDNPFGLTARQLEIVALLAESLTNSQIAARLHLSPKTVDHHVSAVLAKMDVHTREEAADLARHHDL